ncbi:MAG: RsmE family RNA methyltransferase [Planctomycetota bacterium]|nr:16S rRNA (uracil(1498)-N(3))-methyltransferase [Planctomycetota bacterium]MCX8039246.1 16S rRNA (uracil(1498)-N(3))-methyltransferase [Planctomycetota bacterium]MDW8372645.1 RsmE family RNA methyltransferase [Planctomycetota bacterium]
MTHTLYAAALAPGEVELDSEETRHGCRVLRLRPGMRVRLCDGAGRVAEGAVIRSAPRLAVQVAAIATQAPPAAQPLTVAVAPPKGDRWSDLLRGLTELGVGGIVPLRCARGVREEPNRARGERVLREALKQCRRAWLPRLAALTDVAALATSGERLILLDPMGGPPQPAHAAPTTLVIGPEGGFTDAERALLLAAGAAPVRLTGTVLRIETAALAAAALWATTWEHAAR